MADNSDMRVVSRSEVLDAFYEFQDALIKETETKQLLRTLSEDAEKKKRRLFKLIDDAETLSDFLEKGKVEQQL